MESSGKINFIWGLSIIAALFSIYLATVHIDGLAREKYQFKRNVHAMRKKEILQSDRLFAPVNRQKVRTRVVDAIPDKIYTRTINSTVEYIFQYSYTLNDDQAISVETRSTDANRENPILAVVRQQRSVLSWQMPFLLETASSGPQEYNGVSRTLCPEPSEQNTFPKDLFLGISTSQIGNITFDAGVTVVQNFRAQVDKNYTITLSASKPKYFKFLFPEVPRLRFGPRFEI